jgi:hypothetical protein
MDGVDEIRSMWETWKKQRFPSEYSGKDVAGICVNSLDSFAAGCIDTFIFRKGRLDEQRISVLQKCKDDLEVVVSSLDGTAQTYFNNLLHVSTRVLQLVGRRVASSPHNKSLDRSAGGVFRNLID